ncbi:MAG: DUF1206 domain-containing protein [Acidimicrobiales bacterium]
MASTMHDRSDESAREELADRAADSPWVEGLARAGLVARGVLYCVVAVLALQLAFGDHDNQPDHQGALEALARQPFGKVLVMAAAAGFAGYALWRLLSAFLDTEGEGDDAGGRAKRAGDLGRGLLYAGFCVGALRLVAGASGDDQAREADITAGVLKAPVGRVAVALVGVAVICGGLWNGYRALSRKYRKKLETGRLSRAARRWITAIATAGLTARMVVFLLIGTFLVRAAVRYDPNEAVGVDGALRRLAEGRWGPWLLVLVALGLLLFGVYSFVEARYRRLLDG